VRPGEAVDVDVSVRELPPVASVVADDAEAVPLAGRAHVRDEAATVVRSGASVARPAARGRDGHERDRKQDANA
jgi:hypothetical protein